MTDLLPQAGSGELLANLGIAGIGAAVLAVLRPALRVLRWGAAIGKDISGLVADVRRDVTRRARLTLKVEAAVDAWLRERDIEPPTSTDELKVMDVRTAAVDRMVHDDMSGAVDLLEHLGTEQSMADALAFADNLTRSGERIKEALHKRRQQRRRGQA